jgi:putative ABC transport system ATP-binding protein
MIELKNVSKFYPMGHENVRALNEVNLKIEDGEFVAVTGPSGSGKSTLMHIIAGLEKPTVGEVIVDNYDITHGGDQFLSKFRNEKIGYIFQNFHLQPTYNCVQNVALPLVFKKVPRKEREKKAKELLALVLLTTRLAHKPKELSGGERQRVAIARAIINNPKILLADEPTGNLDSSTGELIVEILKSLHKERKITLVVATHDPEISKHADKTICLKDGEIVDCKSLGTLSKNNVFIREGSRIISKKI